MHRKLAIINVTLGVALIALMAAIGSDLLAYRLTRLFPAGGTKASSVPPPPAAPEDLMSFAPILEKGLFGKGTQGKLSPIVSAPPAAAVAAPVIAPGELLLLGTAVGSFRETFALIQKTSSREERVFRLGDTVYSLGPLVLVKKDMAEIVIGGRRTRILTPLAAAAEIAAPAAPVAAGAPGLASQVGAGAFVVDQRALNAALDNIGQAMTDARLLPSVKDGKVEGFRITEVKPAGVFGMIGIRNGDVLLRLNDFAIDSPEKAIQSFVSLKGQSRLKLDLVRDGQPTTFTYDIR